MYLIMEISFLNKDVYFMYWDIFLIIKYVIDNKNLGRDRQSKGIKSTYNY